MQATSLLFRGFLLVCGLAPDVLPALLPAWLRGRR